MFAAARDITERKQAEAQILNLALHDPLTLLPNRLLLNDRLSQILASSNRSARYGALMFLDLDKFKPINDMQGHHVGDLLLKEAARRINSCVREQDIVARFGGDEFVVALSDLDMDRKKSYAEALIVAEKLLACMDKPYLLKTEQEGKTAADMTHHCSASIGVVLFLKLEAEKEEIIRRADTAMYHAKVSGGNAIRFFDVDFSK